MYSICAKCGDEDALFAAAVLSQELEARTGLSFPVSESGSIRLCTDKSLAPAPEGFRLTSRGGEILIAGFDRLGVIHGVGRLLRTARWAKGSFSMPDTDISDAPEKPLRGNQLGYRPKTNAYDAWDKPTYAQYIREQALFGASSVEFMPPVTDDQQTSPVMKVDQLEMNVFLSETAHSYGLHVWFWYPNIFKNETGALIPRSGFTGNAALDELLRREDAMRERDFAAIPYIDDISIPSGDPGDLLPDDLFAFCGRCADILHKHHPEARVWISGQIMQPTEDFARRFYAEANKPHDWLYGLCYAPWMHILNGEFVKMIPEGTPVRNYPDICHLITCQYPVHDWDTIWAVTAGRECYNPRPRAHKRAHELTADYNLGNICYSEGIADDVNKHLWLDMDWSHDIPYSRTLRDFASMYVSPAHADELGAVIASFEDILSGPALTNTAVAQVAEAMKALKAKLDSEEYMPGFGADSYKFNMALLMARYYAYVQLRARRDAGAYARAMAQCDLGLPGRELIERMRGIISEVFTSPDQALHDEIWALADRLFEQIGWQTSSTRHFAQNWGRGGFLDSLDTPLCNAYALLYRLDRAERLGSDGEIYAEIDRIRLRDTAAPGGRYINFGSPDSMRCIRFDHSWDDEPEAIHIPRIEHSAGTMAPDLGEKAASEPMHTHVFERVSSILGYYDGKVELAIDGLIPRTAYELRIVFSLRFGWHGKKDIQTHVFAAGKELACAGFDPDDDYIYIYSVPAEAVGADGRLTLSLTKDDGPRGTGVTELWLNPVK